MYARGRGRTNDHILSHIWQSLQTNLLSSAHPDKCSRTVTGYKLKDRTDPSMMTSKSERAI